MNLENVKVGDRLMTTDGRSFSNKKIIRTDTVERLTKTQIVLSNGSKIKKDTGVQIGTGIGWDYSIRWEPIDHKVVEEIKDYNFDVDIERAKNELIDLGMYNKKALNRLMEGLEDECSKKGD